MDDYGCCALDPTHDGACEWICGDCDGTGRCPLCEIDCPCDDVVACDLCEGTDACPAGCYEGRITEEVGF